MNMGAQDCRINLGYIYIHINQSPKRRSNIYYGGLNTGCWWVDEVCFIVLWSMSKHGTLQLLFFMYESYRRFWDCQFACFHFYFDLRLAIPKHCEKSKNNALKHAICSNDSNVSIRQHSNKLSHTHTSTYTRIESHNSHNSQRVRKIPFGSYQQETMETPVICDIWN